MQIASLVLAFILGVIFLWLFPVIAKMGKLFDTGVDYYLYNTAGYVSDRMITADISEALVNCDTDTRMYCREMIKRTVAYSELLAKNMGGKKK